MALLALTMTSAHCRSALAGIAAQACRALLPRLPLAAAVAAAAGGWGCASNGRTDSGDESAAGSAGVRDGGTSMGSGAQSSVSGSSSGLPSGTNSGGSAGSSGDAGSEPRDASLGDGAAIDAGGDGACVPNLKCKPVPPDSGDYYVDCVTQVNQFRACVCKPPLERWTAGESCANQEAQYDEMADAAHAGFEANICSPEGNGECECPGYPSEPSIISLCLQQMFDEGPPDTGYNHFSIMTASTATMVACGIYTDSKGTVWALQNYQE